MANGLLVGRFQPFHLGHLDALRFALSMAERLWVGIGSSNRPPDAENPFTVQERRDMILASLDAGQSARISLYDIPDVDNHIEWLDLIDGMVPPFGIVFTNDCMTAHLYSTKRSGIRPVSIPFLNRSELSGTRIRDMIRNGNRDAQFGWRLLVPPGTRDTLLRCGAESRLAKL